MGARGVGKAQQTVRAKALDAAKTWLLTPYCHGASVKGQGCDCAGLVRGVWRDVVGNEPWTLPSYGPDWAEADPGSEAVMVTLCQHFQAVALEDLRPGMVMAFRMRPRAPVKHVGIYDPGPTPHDTHETGFVIHAYFGQAVVRSALVSFWRSRLVGVFDWPQPIQI